MSDLFWLGCVYAATQSFFHWRILRHWRRAAEQRDDLERAFKYSEHVEKRLANVEAFALKVERETNRRIDELRGG